MQLTSPVDVYKFLKSGTHKNRLPPQVANMIMRRIERLSYTDMPADHCDAGPRFRGRLEEDEGLSKLLRSIWRRILAEDLADLNNLFNADIEDTVINVIRLGSGYELDWHNHLSAKPTATLLVYLFSDEGTGRGGDLVFGDLGSDFASVSETHRFRLEHGDAVLMGDVTHPLMQHKADRWQGDGWRYIISFAFNALDW